MIDTIGWIVTINVAMICFTAWKCARMRYDAFVAIVEGHQAATDVAEAAGEEWT